jgi:sugar lactone lactonase YvrE
MTLSRSAPALVVVALSLPPVLVASGCREPARDGATPSRSAGQALGYRIPPDAVADAFLGQVGAAFNTVNRVEGRELNTVDGMALDRSATPPRLYVVDSNNHRVLAWADATGYQSGAPADLVLGQADLRLTANGCTLTTAETLCTPRDVAVDAVGNVYVSDTGHNRVLQFDRPFATDRIADRVFGQNGSFSTSMPNLGGAPSASSLSGPAGLVVTTGGALIVADSGNHRVLRVPSPLTSAAATSVLGQPGLQVNPVAWPDERGLQFPTQAAVDPTTGRLYVADTNNHRVLGWPDAAALTDGAPAALVIGQADFFGTACNQGRSTGPTDATLCRPRGLAVDAAGNLYVADNENNRVVRFPSPFASPEGPHRADLIFGQATPQARGCTSGRPEITSLCAPRAVAIAPSGDLFIADTNNHRVLRFAAGAGQDLLADGVFGQPSLTATGCNTGGVPSALTLCSPRGVSVDRLGNLYVADASNHRVLQYDAPLADAQADRVFGQGGSFATAACNLGGARSASTLCSPGAVATDSAGNLWVGDESNERVLGFLSPRTDPVADQVLGQTSFSHATSCTSVSTTCMPGTVAGVAVDRADHLFVADAPQHRALWFQSPFTSNAADRVLGQPDFSSRAPNGADARGLNAPTSLALDLTADPARLYVADTGHHRVLVWDSESFTDGQPAARIIGQALSSGSRCNAGGVSASSLCTPQGLAVDLAGRLFVADGSNHRVLKYETPVTSRVASSVIGQSSLTRNTCNDMGPSASSLCGPRGLALAPDGEWLWVSDRSNHRVLAYRQPLTTDGIADRVLGQPDFLVNGFNWMDGAGLNGPFNVAFDRRVSPPRVYVVDRSNHRVLGWASEADLLAGREADLVLGQPSFTSAASNFGGRSASSFSAPGDAAVDGSGRLYVADTGNHRVLIFDDPFAATPPYAASAVLGQADFVSGLCNRGGAAPTQATLCGPSFVAVDADENLYVSDTTNHRVLVFNAPRTTDTDADDVFGQPNPFTAAANSGGLSASSLNAPTGVAVDESVFPPRLYVSDGSNHRILVYENPRGSDTAADFVLGQVNLTSNSAGSGVSKISGPQGVAVDRTGNVYVADLNNSRALLFVAPLTTDLNADLVFGQPTAATAGCNSSGVVSETTLCGARGVAVDESGSLFVTDTGNHRVAVYLANKLPRALDARLSPVPATTATALSLIYQYQDEDLDPEGAPRVRWLKGGVEQAAWADQVQVPASGLRRGDSWEARLRPFDGLDLGEETVLGPVDIGNGAPSVSAVPDFKVMIDQRAVLGATGEDPDGDPITFAWRQVGGPAVALSPEGASGASFQPQDPGAHRFEITATDGSATSAPAEVVVTVITHGPDNQPPVAVAAVGTGRPVVGAEVELDGSASSDPDPLDRLSYEWTPIAFPTGNPPELLGPGSARPVFVPAVEGPYGFRLRVSDGDLVSAPVDVHLTVSKAGCSVAGGGPALALLLLLLLAAPRAHAQKKPVDLSLPPPPPGMTLTPSGPPNTYLDEARQLYLNFEFDAVIPRLEMALAVSGVTPSQRMEIYKLMAFTHAAFDDPARAQDAFVRLLQLEPAYQLSAAASPKLRGAFAAAKKTFQSQQVVKLEHAPPAVSGAGVTTVVEVAVVSGQERVAAVALHYRLEGAREYSQVPMAAVKPGTYSAPVPNLFDVPSGLKQVEYFIRAQDREGAMLASAGGEAAPLKVTVETVSLDSRRPLLQRWELWTAVGVGAAAVAVPLLLRRDASVQPGSLGLEKLP